jgi:hypothetical protein
MAMAEYARDLADQLDFPAAPAARSSGRRS